MSKEFREIISSIEEKVETKEDEYLEKWEEE
jgi:hypothetical protein